MNRERVRQHLQEFKFQDLFIEEMGWSQPASTKPQSLDLDGQRYTRQSIAQLSGVQVIQISPIPPTRQARQKIHAEIARTAHENLLIFVDHLSDPSQSLWFWMKREGKKAQAREHLYLKGQAGDLFLSKLDGLVVELNDFRADGTVPLLEVTQKLASSLDIERVTKKFYSEFSSLRVEFIDLIEGIERSADRFWYASVLLNRLMFIYFLQKKHFIQNNTSYLENKLRESQTRGAERYYSEFLQALFFEGFAKPSDKRSPQARALIGDIIYLNGGLFLRHKLELEYPNIRIPDRAFEQVFSLFGRYSWHLDDTPGADDNEINPDVLGYIFEKYINQKAFGAYYTRPEITQYLCERTIHAVIIDKLNARQTRHFEDMGEVLLRLDAELCRHLLDILQSLSILDPACGSGAFLVAAMKTLLDIYAAIYGKIAFLSDPTLQRELALAQQHASLNYYIRKRIISDNLYGVDIMEEASEIARLRLFLFLVSSVQRAEQLEPLPNIDFNIQQGNSLIGLVRVDAKRFDSKRYSNYMFQAESADAYRALLDEKNRLIQTYKHTADMVGGEQSLASLRQQIEDAQARAYATLDALLLEDFQTLGIQYEQAQSTGKPRKRPLTQDDIRALAPFHWGYEFNDILAMRGGFDVIIANPPWEIFKPQAKEFFAEYSDSITKNKMTIKDFEQELDSLLQDPDIANAWLDYQSRFPHISAYYRSSSQFANQISVVNGKKAGTDINLYKLFVEQCYNLLRQDGECGIVIPSGIYTDLGAKQLRELLFAHTQITGLFGFENRRMIFEGVDSRFKFVVMTYRKGGKTERFPAAFMRHEVSELDGFPRPDSLQMSVASIRKLAPDSLSIPEFKSELDAHIADKLSRFPLLGETLPDKWNVKFTREFDMTNDSHLFKQAPAQGRLPLYEGKLIHQFTHQWQGASLRYWVDEAQGRQALVGARGTDKGQTLDYQGYRLATRAIARNTDSRTLIGSIVPQNVFCGNSALVAKSMAEDGYRYLTGKELLVATGLISSLVVDYALRQSVSANINMFYLYQLPVPRLVAGERFFAELVERAARLICTTPEFDDLAQEVGIGSHRNGVTDEVQRARLRAEIDGMVAHLYGLSESEFAHILSSFPLVSETVKQAALEAYRVLG